MEVEPYFVPKDCCSLWDATDRFVCNKSQHSAQKVCVMDTRPSVCCNRCVQCPVVRPTVLCVSSLQSDTVMIMRCVQRIKNQKGKILLVTPVWRSRPWYPLLFSLLYDQPLLLPNSETPLLPPSNQKALKPQLNINKLTLAVWPLSGNASLNTKFLSVQNHIRLMALRNRISV